MSALADSAGARPKPARLGEILIERGLISYEQLELALADQQVSGDLLGAILIERGFVAPTTIAAALATQFGGLLKTEYGFATGFGPNLEPAPPVQPEVNDAPPVRFSPELVGASPEPDAAPAQPVSPPAEDRTLADVTRDHDEAASSAEIERLLVENAKFADQLVADRDAWRAEIERLGAENRSLEGKLAEHAQSRDERAAAAVAEAENTSLVARLAELTAERDAARAAPASGNEGLATRLAEVELLLARVTNRSATISERLDEVIGDVGRLHERLGIDATASPASVFVRAGSAPDAA